MTTWKSMICNDVDLMPDRFHTNALNFIISSYARMKANQAVCNISGSCFGSAYSGDTFG